MQQILINYYSLLVHPFKDHEDPDKKIGYVEILGISWALHIIYAFYSVFAILIGLKTFEYALSSNSFSQMILSNFNLTLQKFSIIFGISEAIFYPLVFHFTFKFWKFLLSFYGQIYNSEVNIEHNSTPIINTLFAANLFLILPIGGKLLSTLAQIYYMYLGLVKKLKFSNLQAFLVLMTPLFLIFIFSILIVSYFVFLVSLI